MNLFKTLVVVFSCTGFLFAQTEATTTTETKTVTKTHVKKNNSMKMHGEIISVDAITNTIIVKTKKAEDTLNVGTDTKIMSGKKVIAIGDLKTGAYVTMTCTMTDGKKNVTKIFVKADSDSVQAK